MRKMRRVLTLCMITAMLATSICLPVYADGDGIYETPLDYGDSGQDVSRDVPQDDPVIIDPILPPIIPGPGPVLPPQQLPTPQETLELRNYILSNNQSYNLTYSVDGGVTWSSGTTSNPVDISSAEHFLAPGGTVSVKYLGDDDANTLDSPIQIINITQASAPAGVYGIDPTTIGGQGTINGANSGMEYANGSLLGAPYNAINGDFVNVDPGMYYVRTASSGSCIYSDSVTVTVNPFRSQKEPTPNAVFDAVSMVLSNMSVNMEYCFDGVTWTHIADGSPTSKTLSDDDAVHALAHGIQIIKKGNGSTTTDSDIQTISISKGSTPNCVQGVAPVDKGNSGKIINVDASMQYKANGAASWIDIGSNTVTNLASGTYLVRVRASGTRIASDSVTVNIGQFVPVVLPKEHTPGSDFNAQNMVLSDIIGTKYSLDGGSNWTYAKDYNQITLHDGQVNADKGIKAFRPGNGTSTSDSDVQTINLHKANVPSGVNAISATSTSLGALNGLNNTMEYGPKGGSWTAASASTVLLPAGVYYIRTRGAYTTLASDPIEVDIHTAATPVSVTPIQPVVKPTAAPSPQITDTDSEKRDTTVEKKPTQAEVDEKVKEDEAKKAEEEKAAEEPTPTPIPVALEPNIAGNEGITGWTAIEQSVTSEPVVVNMNGSTEVSAAVLKAVKAAKSEIVLGISEDVVWTIPGSAVADDVADVNLGVIEDTNSIPQEDIDAVAKNSIETRQFEVEYDGDFGFRATLSMRTNQNHAGKYANLFCYKGAGVPMEFIDSSQIDANGGMSFGMIHASSYVIVVSDEKYSEPAAGTADVKTQTKSESKTGWGWIIVLMASVIIVAAVAVVLLKKRQAEIRNRHSHR